MLGRGVVCHLAKFLHSNGISTSSNPPLLLFSNVATTAIQPAESLRKKLSQAVTGKGGERLSEQEATVLAKAAGSYAFLAIITPQLQTSIITVDSCSAVCLHSFQRHKHGPPSLHTPQRLCHYRHWPRKTNRLSSYNFAALPSWPAQILGQLPQQKLLNQRAPATVTLFLSHSHSPIQSSSHTHLQCRNLASDATEAAAS